METNDNWVQDKCGCAAMADAGWMVSPIIESVVGSPPISTNESEVTLEHLMRRLEILDDKMPSMEELDKNMHLGINKLSSQVGYISKKNGQF